jgi:hypothetical protein
MDPLAGMEESRLLALQWRGDRYQLRRDSDGQFSIIWKIVLKDEKSAKSLVAEVERSMIQHFRETQALREIEVSSSGTTFTLSNFPKK